MIHHQQKNCQFRIKLLPSVQTQDTQTAPGREPLQQGPWFIYCWAVSSSLWFHTRPLMVHIFFMRVKMCEHLPSSLHVLTHVSNHPVKLLDPSLQVRTRRRPATCLSTGVGDGGVGIWAQSLTFTPADPRNSSSSSLPSTFQSETTNPQGL